MARPRFTSSVTQRAIVKSMAAVGIAHQDIALKIGVRSPKTLRKHFRDELDVGATDANYKVARTLFKMATSGEHPAATIFWAKTRNGFREHPNWSSPVPPPPFLVQEKGVQQS